jgi:hypothetical protein
MEYFTSEAALEKQSGAGGFKHEAACKWVMINRVIAYFARIFGRGLTYADCYVKGNAKESVRGRLRRRRL